MIHIGIDPGLTGAIAAVQVLADGERVSMRVDDMPVKASGGGKTKRTVKRRVDGLLLSNLLESMCGGDGEGDRVKVYVEEVWSNPNQGVSTVFSFGVSYGTVIGVVEGMGFDPVLVRPQEWKAMFGLIGKEVVKADSVPVAVSIYPELADRLMRKKDNGRADALLLATFAAVKGGDVVISP